MKFGKELVRRPIVFTLVLGVLILTASLRLWAGYDHSDYLSPDLHVLPDTPEEIAYWEEQDKHLRAGEFHKRLKMLVDYPGVVEPDLVEVADVDFPASTPIVGVEVDGEYCAFVLSEMLDRRNHIVNLMVNNKPLSVTYCDMVDCVRVLADDAKQPIPLHIGGLDADNQMVFLLNGTRYGQSSLGLPLRDHPFTRMSLGEWRELHSSTRVYVGTPISI